MIVLLLFAPVCFLFLLSSVSQFTRMVLLWFSGFSFLTFIV